MEAGVNREFLRRLAGDVREAVNAVRGYVSKPYEELSEAERYAVRYHLIVLAEALASLALHVARRWLNVQPETPAHAFNLLRDGGLISEEERRDMVDVVRLRNLLVHRYWAVDDRRIYENARRNFEKILKALERVCAHVGVQV